MNNGFNLSELSERGGGDGGDGGDGTPSRTRSSIIDKFYASLKKETRGQHAYKRTRVPGHGLTTLTTLSLLVSRFASLFFLAHTTFASRRKIRAR